MKTKSYKDLEAYKKGYELVKIIYQETKNFPKDEIYGLTNQIRRSSISIPSNIAEGYMRGSKEYMRFLKVALGSCAELETQWSLSKDIGYITGESFNKSYKLIQEIMKLLVSYLKGMEKRLA